MPCCSANLFPCGYHRGKLKSVDIFSQIWMEYEVWTYYRSMVLLESKIIANNKVLEVQVSKSSEAWFELTLSELLSLHWFERGEFSSLNSAEDSEVPDFVHRRWFLLPIITFVVTEPRRNRREEGPYPLPAGGDVFGVWLLWKHPSAASKICKLLTPPPNPQNQIPCLNSLQLSQWRRWIANL